MRNRSLGKVTHFVYLAQRDYATSIFYLNIHLNMFMYLFLQNSLYVDSNPSEDVSCLPGENRISVVRCFTNPDHLD